MPQRDMIVTCPVASLILLFSCQTITTRRFMRSSLILILLGSLATATAATANMAWRAHTLRGGCKDLFVSANATLADPATAAAVNFSFFPVPDSGTNPGVGCDKSDKIEVCALDATGCQYGCSGSSVQTLLSFITCLEHPGPEGVCHPNRQSECATKPRLRNSAIQTCLADSAKVKSIGFSPPCGLFK